MSFTKDIYKYSFQFKLKGKDGERMFSKYYIMYNEKITNIIEVLKEELCKIKLYIKLQVVAY